ncbi:hypothetical protein C8A03DRAFT_19904, partial [Achaetomium macrosporum]
SSVAASPVQEGGASIPQLSAAVSNNDRVLVNVGPSMRPSVSQDPVRLQQSLGRRPRSGTDMGLDQRPADDSTGEHGREDVTQPPRKRHRSSPTPAVGETTPKRQANLRRASSRSPPAQRPRTRHIRPHRPQRGNPQPRSSGMASTTEQARAKPCIVERILDFQGWYLVQWEWYGPEHNSWEPADNFDQCPELLKQFHRTGLVTTKPSTTKKAQKTYFNVEHILDFEVRYLVQWKGYGPEHNSWVPVGQFDRCPELLLQFHERMGSVEKLIARKILALMGRLTGQQHRMKATDPTQTQTSRIIGC